LEKTTRSFEAYKAEKISERHRHRYEFNNTFRQQFMDKGLVIAGRNPEQDLVEIIEIKDHPWFVGCQFHPEFKSKPDAAHPLFRGFIAAALNHGK
jgi:CTP synthase